MTSRRQPIFLPFLFFFFFSAISVAQIRYEPGYFIGNSNDRIECLVNNAGWLHNPVKFKYKLAADGEVLTGEIQQVKEFGVGNVKFIREMVRMDTSSQDVRNLSGTRNPAWDARLVFLAVVVDGLAKLFHYKSQDLELFFFSVNSSPIEQLTYKRFMVNNIQLSFNEGFKGQLITNVACDETVTQQTRTLRYSRSALAKFFMAFNECNGGQTEAVPSKKHRSKGKIYLSISPGKDYSKIGQVSDAGALDNKKKPDPGWRVGIMTEVVMPFNRNKWTAVLEPTYQSSISSGSGNQHKSIELPIGARHYFFLPKDAAIFVDFFVVIDFPMKYTVSNAPNVFAPGVSKEPVAGCAAGGLGFFWKRFSIEGRYYFNRRILSTNRRYLVDYDKASVILGFRFKK